jgi:hypothetical protein
MVVTACDAIFTCVFFWVTKYLALLAHKVILKSNDIMIEDNNKLMEDKQFFKKNFDLF